MLYAVLNFGQAVYNHDHLDVLMENLINFINTYEWNVYKDSPLCNWTTSVTVKDISYHLDVEIWKYKYYEGMDKEILNKKEPCPKFNGYYLDIKFQMDNEGEERSPLYDKWQELFKFKVSHRLKYNEDFQRAKELFWDIEKFFMDPEAFMEDDDEEGCEEEEEEDFSESEDDSDEESPYIRPFLRGLELPK